MKKSAPVVVSYRYYSSYFNYFLCLLIGFYYNAPVSGKLPYNLLLFLNDVDDY